MSIWLCTFLYLSVYMSVEGFICRLTLYLYVAFALGIAVTGWLCVPSFLPSVFLSFFQWSVSPSFWTSDLLFPSFSYLSLVFIKIFLSMIKHIYICEYWLWIPVSLVHLAMSISEISLDWNLFSLFLSSPVSFWFPRSFIFSCLLLAARSSGEVE